MKQCKWFGMLFFLVLAFQAGNATTDYLFFNINGDTTINNATQGDMIGWGANCGVGAVVGWEIYYDTDSDHVIDVPGDKLLFAFGITDGNTGGSGGPADNDPVPDGMIIVTPMLLGFAPGYYIMKATDQSDFSTVQDWFSIDEMTSPTNTFSGTVTIPGHSAPDALLKNIWIAAECDSLGLQMWTALTDENGLYTIDMSDFSTGLNFRISAEAIAGYANPGPQYETASGNITDIDFTYMTPADSVFGVVKDQEDNPIPNVYVWANPRFSGPGEKEVNSLDGSYVIYFGNTELGEWDLGISSDGLMPNYMVPQSVQIDNSVNHEIEQNFVAYTTDTAIYVRVTEMGSQPANSYRIQAFSNALQAYGDAVSGTGADNILAVPVSTLDPSGYSVTVSLWDDNYPIPDGYIVESGQINDVAPGDTVDINFVTGIMVQDTIKVDLPDPGVDWSTVWVNFWSEGKNFGGNPDNNGVFTIYVDSGTYLVGVSGLDYLCLPQQRSIHVTEDTIGGMGFTINYAGCHITGHITGVDLPLDSGLMVGGYTGTWPNGYSQFGRVDTTTGAFDFYVCDGDWTFNPPTITGTIAPPGIDTAISETDTLITFDIDYRQMRLVSDTIKVDAGDPAVTWSNVQVTLTGPGGYFSTNPDINGVFQLYADTGLFSLNVFYNDYLACPGQYPLHLLHDTTGGLGFTLNKIDIHITGQLIAVDLPLPSSDLHINGATGVWPEGYFTTSAAIDSITGNYDIYVCDGDWTFTAPDIEGFITPDPWTISFDEAATTGNHDFAYSSSGANENRIAVLPSDFALMQNSPNPFNPNTNITFALPVRSHVELTVYNILGQKIKVLADGDYAAGTFSKIWDGTDQSGYGVGSGIYFYRLAANDRVLIKKMVLLK